MSRTRAYQMSVSKVVAADANLTQVCTEPLPRWAARFGLSSMGLAPTTMPSP